MTPTLDPGSFRDPAGYIFHWQGRIIRSVNRPAVADFQYVRDTGLFDDLAQRGWIIPWKPLPEGERERFARHGRRGAVIADLVEHPRLNFVSHPYEWTFPQLKAAALQHLRIQITALERGVALSDASAYNMQWDGWRPLHIDILSFRKYRPGEVWVGYDQFCRQFLFPLLLEAHVGVPFQSFYRGTLEGIPLADIVELLPWRRKYLSIRGLMHLALRARIEGRTKSHSTGKVARAELSLKQFRALLDDMSTWIAALKTRRATATYWAEYATRNSYQAEAEQSKQRFVREYAKAVRPKVLWDLGGNTGVYSRVAIEAGAENAIVIDGDQGALEWAFQQSRDTKLPLLPIFMDLADPSSDRGWRQRERKGLSSRAPADGILALAIVHHLAIGRNIPLPEVVDWIMDLSPTGVIEFVPKSDPMVIEMLANRDDIFSDYSEANFRNSIMARGSIIEELRLTEAGRLIVSFRIRDNPAAKRDGEEMRVVEGSPSCATHWVEA